MAVVNGIPQIKAALARIFKRCGGGKVPNIVVGYTAAYALHVHENVEMKLKGEPRKSRGKGKPGRGKYWDPQGRAQAKFLEQPAREMGKKLGTLVGEKMKKGGTLEKALFAAGTILQGASQRLVPVDSGNLKGSAFTAIE
jgi:hypothetical protein